MVVKKIYFLRFNVLSKTGDNMAKKNAWITILGIIILFFGISILSQNPVNWQNVAQTSGQAWAGLIASIAGLLIAASPYIR